MNKLSHDFFPCSVQRYWQLRLDKVGVGGSTRDAWDRGVFEASEEYKGRIVGALTVFWSFDHQPSCFPQIMPCSQVFPGNFSLCSQHNLCCDNCHSHVAYALNTMRYDGSTSWNMIKLCFLMLFHSKYVRLVCVLFCCLSANWVLLDLHCSFFLLIYSFCGFLKTWLPFSVLVVIAIIIAVVLSVWGQYPASI